MTDISYPWEQPLAVRVQQLQSRTTKVMYFSDAPNPGSFRYRVYNMVCALETETNNISASYFSEADGHRVLELVKQVDRLVIHRTLYTDFVARLILTARHHNVPVFYDIDDYVFDELAVPKLVHNLEQLPNSGENADAVWTTWFGWVTRYRMVLERCDKVLTTTQFLADLVEKTTGKTASVVRNFLGVDETQISEQVYAAKLNNPLPRNSESIGYFAGSYSHQRDLEVAAPGICQFLAERPNATFQLFGYGDLDRAGLTEFGDQVTQHDFVAYQELPQLIAEVGINIAPLLQNDFTNAKSELKYFSAAAVGTLTIATPTAPMLAAIKPNATGWLADGSDWYQALTTWADTPASQQNEMVAAAHADAIANYTAPGVIGQLLKALDLA